METYGSVLTERLGMLQARWITEPVGNIEEK